MTVLKDYMGLKKKEEQYGRTADRAAGVLGQVMKRLKSDFDCSTLKDARKKLKLLKKQRQKARMAFVKEKEKFEEKYPDA